MMEQEIPFKIFPLPRLSSSHVSAVKPVKVVENMSFFQNLKFQPENAQDYIYNTEDCFSHRVSPLPSIEEENTESLNQLYTKLRREVEKVKKWKSVTELEIKEKESKLQEKRKISDAQQKVIKELQIENEKLRLKLRDVMNENEDLINQTNATRHLCNLLKDTCDRVIEKANIYENEIDETKQIYSDLNNNIERMIMVFEELRTQAENSRNEIYSQIKYEAEKREEMQKEHNIELAKSTTEVLELTKAKEDLSSMLSELKLQFYESTNKTDQLEEASKNHHLEIRDWENKTEEITKQLEEAKLLIQNTKDALSVKEDQLNNTEAKLVEVVKERETRKKELEETRAQHALQLSDLQSEVQSLKEMLVSEQVKLEEKVSELASTTLETHKKSVQLEDITKANEDAKNEIKQLRCDLCETLRVQKELENQLSKEKSENQILVKKEQDLAISLANLQGQFHNVKIENTDLKKLVGDLQDFHNQFLEILKGKDEKNDVLNTQIKVSAMDIDNLTRQVEKLKTDINTKELKCAELKTAYENLAKEKEATKMVDLSNSQNNLKASKQKDQTMKKMEDIEETNTHLRKDNETLKEQLKEKDKEIRNLHNECEDEKRNHENEFHRKEKQQKALENKLSTVKKQIENKNKAIEDLQQENKSLKKKMKEDCKHCSVLETEVNELHVQIKNDRIQHEETISSIQVEIANARAKEETLYGEVQKFKLASDEAIKLQKETDVKCQHKITEMVALMEKHKHQYDKLVEEKDAELCQLSAKVQDTASSSASLAKELSSKNNEILKLKTEFQKEKEEKEKLIKEKIQLKINMKHKDVQTTFAETPKQSAKIGSIQTSSSFSRRSVLADILSQVEPERKSDNKITSPWTSSKSCSYTTPKIYSVKTPPKYANLSGHFGAFPEDPAKKKRKVAVDFDFHSDSSENTDILGLCKNDGFFKSLHVASDDIPGNRTTTPRKILTESSIKPSLSYKASAMKYANQLDSPAFPKVGRRRRMKAAEKIFQ